MMNSIVYKLEFIRGNLVYLMDYPLYDMRSSGKIRRDDYGLIRNTLEKNIASIERVMREAAKR